MDLSQRDIIFSYYGPCECKIRNIFNELKSILGNIHLSFIDSVSRDYLYDSRPETVVTDQLINADLYPNKTILALPESIFGIYYIPKIIEPKKVIRNYNLFMNRASVHRLFWFYKLIEMNMLDKGFVSYIGSTERSTNPELDQLAFTDFLQEKFFSPFYLQQYQLAREIIPYQNFNDHGDLRSVMMQTKISIVIEPYHERTDAIAFSEKIFRAIQVPRPWILSGATGSVDRLRSLGFDVFDDYVNHDYDTHDTEHNCSERDASILKEIMRLSPLIVTEDILKDWNKRCQHNLSILESWHHNWQADLQKFIQKNFPEISNLESLA